MADDGINDEVVLKVGDKTITNSTGYEIHQSVLEQPASFSLRLGQSESIRELINRSESISHGLQLAPLAPNTPFELHINNNLRLTGRIDGYRASAAGNNATEVTVFGRDVLAPLHDAHVHLEKSFTDKTYKKLVEAVLTEVGLDPNLLVTGDDKVLVNRKIQAGVSIKQLLPVKQIDQILTAISEGAGVEQTAGAAANVLQCKIGERWQHFLRTQLDRAGLILYGGASGSIILTAPNSNQEPIYRIVRRRGQTRDLVNVVHADYLNDTRPCSSFAVVYGRGPGKKKGRPKSIGQSTDGLMLDYGFGIGRGIAIRDTHCQNSAQAAYLAQRKLAEGRRHGFQLVYTLAGHSTPAIKGGRAIWTPDTVVSVQDDEFGIEEDFWIDAVTFQRGPQTTTTIRLMRKSDIVFGTADFEGANVKTGFKDNLINVLEIEEILEKIRNRGQRG